MTKPSRYPVQRLSTPGADRQLVPCRPHDSGKLPDCERESKLSFPGIPKTEMASRKHAGLAPGSFMWVRMDSSSSILPRDGRYGSTRHLDCAQRAVSWSRANGSSTIPKPLSLNASATPRVFTPRCFHCAPKCVRSLVCVAFVSLNTRAVSSAPFATCAQSRHPRHPRHQAP